MDRRRFLCLLAAAASLPATLSHAKPVRDQPYELYAKETSMYVKVMVNWDYGPRAVRMKRSEAHGGEYIDRVYFDQGRYKADVLEEIGYFLRDPNYTDYWRPAPAPLLDRLFVSQVILADLGYQDVQRIVSASRHPKTNRAVGGVPGSEHVKCNAVDVKTPGVTSNALGLIARLSSPGGTGVYPNSNNQFVHYDTGATRYWRGD